MAERGRPGSVLLLAAHLYRGPPSASERALDVALDLEGDALAAWLLDPSAR